MSEPGTTEQDRDGAAPRSLHAAILRVVVPYVVFAGLWILFSDHLLGSIFQDAPSQLYWSTVKGLLFVLVTAVLLSLLLARELRARAIIEALRRRAEAERRKQDAQHAAEVTSMNERLIAAQEQERTRIAGELHDGIMQRIAVLSLELGTAKRSIPLDCAASAMVGDVLRQLVDVGAEVRQISHALHPPILQSSGLPEALRVCCETVSQARGMPVTCRADESLAELSRGVSLALYRITQEALANAVKHAAAPCIEVRLERVAGDVVLTVRDDGVGCNAVEAVQRGLGMINMRERARQLNGSFEIDSQPGRGTTVRVAIPLNSTAS